MAEYMVPLIGQMKILAVLIVMGILSYKSKLLSDENIDNLSAIMARFILPCMLITVIGSGGTRNDLFGMWKFLIATIIFFILSFAIGDITAKIARLKSPTDKANVLVVGLGNGGFIGTPLVSVMFPGTSGLAIAVYSIVEASFYWIVGPLVADTTASSKKVDFKKVVSPITISIMLGLLIILLNLDFSGNVAWETIKNVGATTKYFAAIYIGLELARKGMKRITAKPKVFITVPFKLIIFPVLVYLVLGKTGVLAGNDLIILTLYAATPTGMLVPLIVKMGQGDEVYATAGTLLNTILCLVTMPFVIWLVSHF